MFMVLKKKKVILYSVTFFLLISCCFGVNNSKNSEGLNISNVTSDGTSDTSDKVLLPGETLAVSSNNNYFLKTKNDREIIRSKATELLRSILDDTNSSPESKKEAENAIINMADEMDKEAKAESLLSAKGFRDNVVFISNGSTTVTLRQNNLSDKDIAKINDIVSEITGNNNIKIVEVD